VVFANRSVKIDDVEPLVTAKFVKLGKNVGHDKLATASLDQLNGLAGL
jgi:hypothetical protein